MTFDEIFAAYYTLYRGDADTPASTDDEYTIGMRLANEAIRRWSSYDGTYWKELFATLVGADDGDKTIVTGQKTYTCPSDFREGAGVVNVLDTSGNVVQSYKVVNPEEVQFKSTDARIAYFTGNPSVGYTLNLGTTPSSTETGLEMNYMYYKTPTIFSTGSDITEIADPYFIIHRMLAQRFRISRNPYYNSALRDAEDSMRMMKLDNDSGSWANPWSVPDNSGSSWGV